MKLWITSPDYRRIATLSIGCHAYDIFYIDIKLCKLLIKISLNQNINIKDAIISVVPDLRDILANELVIWCPKLMSGYGGANFRICECKYSEHIRSRQIHPDGQVCEFRMFYNCCRYGITFVYNDLLIPLSNTLNVDFTCLSIWRGVTWFRMVNICYIFQTTKITFSFLLVC